VQAILHDQDLMTFALILLERADQSLQHDVRDLLIGAARQEQDTRLYLPRMIPDDVLSEQFIARETLASRTPLNRPIHPRSRLHHPGQGRRCRLGERRKSCFAVHKDERIRHERRASNDALRRAWRKDGRHQGQASAVAAADDGDAIPISPGQGSRRFNRINDIQPLSPKPVIAIVWRHDDPGLLVQHANHRTIGPWRGQTFKDICRPVTAAPMNRHDHREGTLADRCRDSRRNNAAITGGETDERNMPGDIQRDWQTD
jgi:hypothetical protein